MGDRAAVIALSVETDLSPDAVAEYAEQNDFLGHPLRGDEPDLLAAFVDAFGNSAANPPSTPKIRHRRTGPGR